jgi:hypothetical protein
MRQESISIRESNRESDGTHGKVTTSEVETEDGVGKGVTLVDGNGVGDTVSRVEDDTGSATRSVEGEDGLDGNVEGRGVERLEHDLGHLLAVDLGVEGSLSEEDGVLLGGDTELVVELQGEGDLVAEKGRKKRRGRDERCGAKSSPCRPSW